jgi:hypothetical protein
MLKPVTDFHKYPVVGREKAVLGFRWPYIKICANGNTDLIVDIIRNEWPQVSR